MICSTGGNINQRKYLPSIFLEVPTTVITIQQGRMAQFMHRQTMASIPWKQNASEGCNFIFDQTNMGVRDQPGHGQFLPTNLPIIFLKDHISSTKIWIYKSILKPKFT